VMNTCVLSGRSVLSLVGYDETGGTKLRIGRLY
jgi:hypothetical protein